jgi:hypothetical protein
MGNASRQRRLKKERERQRQRAPKTAESSRTEPGSQQGQARVPSEDELVSSAIVQAMDAVSRGIQDAYGEHLDELAIERRPGWTRAVSLGLAGYLRTSVTSAWQRGWQPAELVRQLGRELSPAHATLVGDMIAAEMSGYPAAAVDPRWAAQVAAIEADAPGKGAWWGRDAEYLGARYALGLAAEFIAVVAVAVETLHAFQHLPGLEQLLPLPGTARAARPRNGPPGQGQAGQGSAGETPADERMLGRIRALLAKAEATEFAEEAEALSARAQQLMAKYSIDHALLAAESGREEAAGGRRIAVDNPYEGPKTTLLQTVAAANRCRVVWTRELGLVTVVGFPADLDAVELLFTSLLVQANTAMLRTGGKRDSYGRSRTRAFRQSFLVSYAIRIGERLAEAASQAEDEAVAEQRADSGARPAAQGKGTDLVPFLAARERAVDDAVDTMFGPLTRSRGVRVSDEEGWASGRAAADLATLQGRTAVRPASGR